MQTNLTAPYRNSVLGQQAEKILRSCVHCGFCTATCPTYQLLGDELDGPRGRIYLIKQMLEGEAVSRKTQTHLDRCLTCRSCETTCPSGVRYGQLLDIGRELLEQEVARPNSEKVQRYFLRKILPYPRRFRILLTLAQTIRFLLPASIKRKIPVRRRVSTPETAKHARRMLVLAGCAQSVTTPQTNASASQLFSQLGISLITAPTSGCCGAVSQHLAAGSEARRFIKRNIDAWWPYVEQGIEAIVTTASGCGVMVKDYGHLLGDDPQYATKAKRISDLSRDVSEVLAGEDLSSIRGNGNLRVAFHNPCTLQHGQKLTNLVENILRDAGYKLVDVKDKHLCCGSAGTYSILQPALSQQFLTNKLSALQQHEPDLIATANVGCQLHLATRANVPVKHWIELLL